MKAAAIALLAALAIGGSALALRNSRHRHGGKTSPADTGFETTEGAATMPSKGDVHVVPSEKGWRVEIEGRSRASGTHTTQAAAWKQAREIARKNKSEALLHGRDGAIRERNTFGHDPSRSTG